MGYNKQVKSKKLELCQLDLLSLILKEKAIQLRTLIRRKNGVVLALMGLALTITKCATLETDYRLDYQAI